MGRPAAIALDPLALAPARLLLMAARAIRGSGRSSFLLGPPRQATARPFVLGYFPTPHLLAAPLALALHHTDDGHELLGHIRDVRPIFREHVLGLADRATAKRWFQQVIHRIVEARRADVVLTQAENHVLARTQADRAPKCRVVVGALHDTGRQEGRLW